MNKHVKNVVIFTMGAIGGFGLCSGVVIKKILSSDDCREFLIKKLTTRITDFLYGDTKSHENSRGIYVEEFVFESRGEATSVLEAMEDLIDKYGPVSVADYYDLCGSWESNYEANKFGWVTLKDAKVVRIREGYKLSLPIPVEL